jgi:WD40 repeat protein
VRDVGRAPCAWTVGARAPGVPHDCGQRAGSPKGRDRAQYFHIPAGSSSVAVSPDGARFLSDGFDRKVRLWDAATGALLRAFEGHSSVSSVAFSPDSARVLSGGLDRKVRLWDAATGALLLTFNGHSGSVSSVAFCARWRPRAVGQPR